MNNKISKVDLTHNIKNIETLILEGNQLKDLTDCISQLNIYQKSLKSVNISHNKITNID